MLIDRSITGVLFEVSSSPTAAAWLAPIVMVAGVVVLGLIFTFSIRGKIARRDRERPSPREHINRLKSSANGRSRMETQQAELQEFAQHLAAQLDNRAERLEQLLEEAETRIAAFEARLSEAELPDRFESSPEPIEPRDPLTCAVYDLADSGRSPIEIAHELDEQVGKVELILALRRAG